MESEMETGFIHGFDMDFVPTDVWPMFFEKR